MVTKAELYSLVLQELEKLTGNVLASAIVTPDGLIISSTVSREVDNGAFAAYSAATFNHARKTMEELSNENIEMLLFESKNHREIIFRARDDALLIAMTNRDSQLGMVLIEMQKTAMKIKGL
ncbi:MAG: roadblock/LC7 domain-containing protein [Candidatus Methanoperedens sp.]|nr:roadblock/LC7 domain-containing protein [Candidatus Methanoperedens sp.]MCE8425391.1 roadblock/LC7 domain-containing protein [Candidatus Methanoperedens sp.]MCE8428346.1 roadblock/LC7 domain-containing protein [Candidatus Methanoperedens sp.]